MSLQLAVAICEKEKGSGDEERGNVWGLTSNPTLQKAEQKRKTWFQLQHMCYWIKHCLNTEIFLNPSVCEPRIAFPTLFFFLIWFELFFLSFTTKVFLNGEERQAGSEIILFASIYCL